MTLSLVNPTRVLCVSNDHFELATLSASLRLNGINIVGEASNLVLADNLLRKVVPDIVVFEIQPYISEPVRFLREARKLIPNLGIVITTKCPDFRLIGLNEKDIPERAQVLLTRSLSNLSLLTDALDKSVNEGESQIGTNWIYDNLLHDSADKYNKLRELTDIQVQTLRLVAQGFSNSEIARLRVVSEKSVEQVVARIAQQLEIPTERSKNLRVNLAAQYFAWLGAPRR